MEALTRIRDAGDAFRNNPVFVSASILTVYLLVLGGVVGYILLRGFREIRMKKENGRLIAANHFNDGKQHLLLAATGSVATIKLPNILKALSDHPNLSIRVLLTESAAKFLEDQAAEQPSLAKIAKIPNVDAIYRDFDEWSKPWVRGDTILHIELRRWADLMVVAPLSANSMAKLANGITDNLFSSVVRAWDATGLIDPPRPGVTRPYGDADKKGIIVAPAMNTAMWSHPATAKHLRVLEEEWGVKEGGWIEVLRPVEKELACGDTGSGAMRDWQAIVTTIKERLSLSSAKASKQ
ncbi:phosphopantothenoylcysteine decarboxylase [Acrodontium crateriforme]|uniref:Phosphopantothenoylcysteine decarboxylase n=1 Tax=Acrodontium crateriforme TaxID=150365 RepID=A0AAQ3MA05_9PEZI|nr:phosphopantothenoylcysteine decarboxylase [Acrodontium crateriforme]